MGDDTAAALREAALEAREGRAQATGRPERVPLRDHPARGTGTDDDDALARYVELC
ncbi:MAG TPA: hypothetical protein VFM03_08430 [Candidatus Limnocylindria bacterium]|jgi:hypothetical protein|nr:hypothetical protein [Candidatus Limnocylindria bacterium]